MLYGDFCALLNLFFIIVIRVMIRSPNTYTEQQMQSFLSYVLLKHFLIGRVILHLKLKKVYALDNIRKPLTVGTLNDFAYILGYAGPTLDALASTCKTDNDAPCFYKI